MAMWRPPQRIRHSPGEGTWPTADQARDSLLFSPIGVGQATLRARTWVPAMVPWRAREDGHVTEDVIDWYRRFAAGRPAAIVVEATGVRDVPSGPLLRIGDDRFIAGLSRIVEAVREASHGETRTLIQLIDFLAIRRRPDPRRFLQDFLELNAGHALRLGMPGAPDEVVRQRILALDGQQIESVLSARELESLRMGYRERVTDLHLPHIRDLPGVLPGLFAAAARRARTAGFDGVELHYTHAYTMASFLSATNDRDDGYGGSREGRFRLAAEVLQEVRAGVGDGFVVGCRISSDECIAGGSRVDDACWYATELARRGVDFVSLSRGGKFDDALQPKQGEAAYPYTGPSGYECMPSYYSDETGPFGRNLAASAAIRRAVRDAGLQTPIVAGGGIHNFEQAERILAEGQADIVSVARQALADPDWFRKVREGRGSGVRLCLYTNYCEALDQRHRQVTCELWDRIGLDDPAVKRSADGRRRLVAPPDDAAPA
jgi:2,4-dienoyl-CoA reductase-like NADH-dependent reductase (Old Yellow Enzyme family)